MFLKYKKLLRLGLESFVSCNITKNFLRKYKKVPVPEIQEKLLFRNVRAFVREHSFNFFYFSKLEKWSM